MHRTSFAHMDCSIARSLEVVGGWWTLLILRDAFGGPLRFEELQRDLGIARTVLAERLQRLVDHGVLERRQYCQHPPRFEYHLSEKGRDLYPVIVGLMCWGDKWAAGDDGPPVVLTHTACGGEGHPVLACRHCGQEVGPTDMVGVPNGARADANGSRPWATGRRRVS